MSKQIINPKDKDLVLANVVLFEDLNEYEKRMDEDGQNWHSGGAILGARVKFQDFSTETQIALKERILLLTDHKVSDNDIVQVECDDEYGLFIRMFAEGEGQGGYAILDADQDSVAKMLYDIDRQSLSMDDQELDL